MTENERQEILKDIKDGYIDAWDNLVIDELFEQIEREHEEIQQYRAIGTIDEFKALKEEVELYRNLDKTNFSDGYNRAIYEFAERLKERIVGMQMAELQGEDVCPCAETGEECPYINQDIGCQYCAREHTIKEIDEIAEEMRGAE